MVKNPVYIATLNRLILSFFFEALKIALEYPPWAFRALITIRHQSKAIRRRNQLEKQGFHVPPFAIFSVTAACNLKCTGCYAPKVDQCASGESVDRKTMIRVLSECRDIGIGTVLIAGGEPFLRPDLLMVLEKFRNMIFPVFTNGLVVTPVIIRELARLRQVIPVISIEGSAAHTDSRRGDGAYEQIIDLMNSLKNKHVFFGVSIMVTRENFNVVTSRDFISDFISKGCRLFFFVEYVPVEEGSEHLECTAEQREALPWITRNLKRNQPALYLNFPGDEKEFGGCLSSGRGFFHINHRGDIEPCPFAPFSDSNVSNIPLRDALKSPILEKLRKNHHELNESVSGCALWEKRAWVRELIQN